MSRKIERNAGVVWAIGGGKGGVGRTFLASNLGASMAAKGHDVIVCDCDFDGPNLHSHIGVKQTRKSIADFTLGRTGSLEEIVSDCPVENLRLIAGAGNALNASSFHQSVKSKFIKSLHALKCDYLIIDTGAGTCFDITDIFMSADIGILPTTAEPASIELLYRFLRSCLYRKLRSVVDQPKQKDMVDRVMSRPDSGNLLAMVDQVLETGGYTDSSAKEAIEEKLYRQPLKLVMNMTRNQRDQEISADICEIVKKYMGFNIEPIGHVPFDELALSNSLSDTVFTLEHNQSDTAAFIGLVSGELEKSISRPVNQQLDLIEK